MFIAITSARPFTARASRSRQVRLYWLRAIHSGFAITIKISSGSFGRSKFSLLFWTYDVPTAIACSFVVNAPSHFTTLFPLPRISKYHDIAVEPRAGVELQQGVALKRSHFFQHFWRV